MQRFAFAGVLSLSCLFGVDARAETLLTCGDGDSLLVHMSMQWPNMHGTGDARGPTLSAFAGGDTAPVAMACARQGGSSMHTWWTCDAPLPQNKRIQCTISTNPEMTVTLSEADHPVQKYKFQCSHKTL